MPLDPQVKALIEQAAAAGLPPYPSLTPVEARQVMMMRTASIAGDPPTVARVEDRWIAGPGGPLRVRLYTPAGRDPFPILVYFHGGGFVVGNVDTHDSLCRAIANAGGCIVASVDYRLAPEHKFPAAVEDAYAATRWVAGNAALLGGDPDRLAVGGDSAGGNLAAVVALRARDEEGPRIRHQLLIYPVTDYSFDTPSYRENGSGYMLSRADMEWFWAHYLASEADGRHFHASPLRAEDLSGLPPALVLTAEFDPLRDEGEAFAARLWDSGVPVTLTRYEGMVHGFVRFLSTLDAAKKAVDQIGEALREAFPGCG
ncbi:MAG: alpha/beta hydrolase [Sphingomonadaceae bacterium]